MTSLSYNVVSNQSSRTSRFRPGSNENMDELTEPEPSSDATEIKTSDVYKVDKNLPTRFNNPECFRGYRQKTINLLYQTTNQTYGSKKPTVHEMPTAFNGSRRKFSEHLLKSGMYKDNGFNTALNKSRLTGPNETTALLNRINFHYLYHTDGKSQ